MNTEVTRYYDDLAANVSMQNRMQQLAEEYGSSIAAFDKDQIYDKVVEFANSEGYDFSKDDLLSYEESLPTPTPKAELASLPDTATGCHYNYDPPPPPNPFGPDFPPWFDPYAVCSLLGVQKCSSRDHTCACFLGGGGAKDYYGHFVCCVGVGYVM